MRKKILYILSLGIILGSCAKEIPVSKISANPDDEIGYEHNGKVTLGFNVDLGEEMTEGTKALAETPDIKNIYVAVFDATGYKLSEYVKANPITTGPLNDHKYQFTIQLKVSDKPRTLHFIANGPKELRFGTEQEIIGELYSSYDADESDEYHRKDAYWQRLVFDKISPRPTTSDPDSLAAYNSMVETLSNLKLIRNFSKVTLSKREPLEGDTQAFKDFQILGMWFVNYPDRGSIAPYNRNTGGFGTDASTYLEYSKMEDVEDPEKGNYQGFTLTSTEFIIPSVFDGSNMISATSNTAYGYVYEREKALTSPMYLIVKGKYNNANAYYKIAMQDEEGNFYAMLRNFNYKVQIQNVSSAGFSTAAEALAGAPTGDISVNIDYKDMPNISDGNARITVSATKLLIVAPENNSTTAQFWYKYEPDIADHEETGIHNDVAKGDDVMDEEEPDKPWNHKHPHVLITYEGTEGSSGAVINNISVAGSNEGGNRYVTITTENASATPKTQTITIEGRKWDGQRYLTITRTIELVLRNALEMNLTASPNTDSEGDANVINGVGESVVLHIGIDKDLPSSMFPLAFKLNPTTNSLTPDNAHTEQDLPARYGTDESGHPDYWFERVVNWSEYQNADVVDGKKELPVYFKTIIANSATSVEVTNEYFESKTAVVNNYTPKTFSSLAFSGTTHKVGEQESFSFHIDGTPLPSEITLSMKGIEPVSATAPATTGYTGSGFSSMSLKKVEGGIWYYSLVPNNDNIAIDIVPFATGEVSIEVGAFLFSSSGKSVNAISGDTSIILMEDFVTAYGQKVSGNYKIVPNQKAKLTIYIPTDKVASSENVTIGGIPTTKTDNGDGTWKITTGNDAYTATTNGYNVNGYYSDGHIVKVGDKTIGSVKIPICGIQTGTALTGATQVVYNQAAGTGWYIIVNNSYNTYHLRSNGTNLLGDNGTYDYNSLFGFSATGGSVKIAVPSASSNSMYYVNGNGNSTTLTYSGTGSTYTFNGTQFSWQYRPYITMNTYYWCQTSNTGNVEGSTTNSNNRFSVLPVTLNSPE